MDIDVTDDRRMRFLVLRDIRYGADDALERVCRAALAAAYGGKVDGAVLAGEATTSPDRLATLMDSLVEILPDAAMVATCDSSAVGKAGGSHPLPGGYAADDVAGAIEAASFDESPFRYGVVQARAGDLVAEPRQLANATPGFVDTHVHTQFAYCGTDITDEAAVDRARRYGLAGICLTEHAGQLYVAKEDFWSADFIHQPALWRAGSRERMDNYLSLNDPLRADDVLVGFESEVDIEGRLILRDEDRERADIILGAVHWINAETDGMTDAQFAAAFCRQTEQVLTAGIDVLAHPVRLFARKGMDIPADIQQTVARMLADADIPGEINFHKNDTPATFYGACLEAGGKLSLGSDGHRIAQAGNLDAHVRLLQQLTGEADVAAYVWNPLTDRKDRR